MFTIKTKVALRFAFGLCSLLTLLVKPSFAQSGNAADKAKLYTIPLQRHEGLAICTVIVNGTKLRCCLDTGAQGLILQKPIIERLHLKPKTYGILQTFAGSEKSTVYAAEAVTVGNLTLKNVEACSVHDFDDGLDGGIGLDFFSDYKITWHLKQGVVSLCKTAFVAPDGSRYNPFAPKGAQSGSPATAPLIVPFKYDGLGEMRVSVTLDNEKGWMVIDTGADESAITETTAARLGQKREMYKGAVWTEEQNTKVAAPFKAGNVTQYNANFHFRFNDAPFWIWDFQRFFRTQVPKPYLPKKTKREPRYWAS